MADACIVEAAMMAFDYGAEAELFPTRNRKSRRQPIGHRRFARGADAVHFAIEELQPEFLLGAHLQVEEARYDGRGIRRMYDSMDYLLVRRGGLAMITRSHSKSVVFNHPFELKSVDRILPPGDYRVVTDEELIEELSCPVYHRVATMIFVPAESRHSSSVEMVTIDPQELQAAQERDRNHDAY